MTKLLEQAIAKLRELSEEEQDALAVALFSLAEGETADVPIDNQTRAAIEEGLAQAERGEFVADADIAALWKRHWGCEFATHREHAQTSAQSSNTSAVEARKAPAASSSPSRRRLNLSAGFLTPAGQAEWRRFGCCRSGRYPYLIYWAVTAGAVWIVHIRHAARRPWEGGN
jgi:predicted transcriptional regulator